MKTNNRNEVDHNDQPRKTGKPQPVNQPQTKSTTGKKGTYIKDMPPIDAARPGVI